MRYLIERFPVASIFSFLGAAGASKGAALRTANEVADLIYTTAGIVFLILSILVLIKKQWLAPKPQKKEP